MTDQFNLLLIDSSIHHVLNHHITVNMLYSTVSVSNDHDFFNPKFKDSD